jgi:hypothetical protein
MHTRNLVSTIALAAALSFTGGAMAQTTTTIAGMEVSAEDLPRVQSHCTSLASMDTESLTETGEGDGEDSEDTGTDTGTDDGEDDDGETGPNDDDADGDDAGSDDTNDTEGDTTDAEADPAAEDGEASDMDNALTAIDLDVLTLENCREAGLID